MANTDFFVKHLIGNEMELVSKGKKIRKKSGNSPQTCYSNKVIPSQSNGIFKWILEINRREHQLVIGIASNYKSTDSEFYKNGKDPNYGYSLEFGQKVSFGKFADYGCKCNRGDKIEMILNLKKKQISFIVNNVNQGVMYNDIHQNKDIKYKLAICIQKNGDGVTLKYFTEIKDQNTQLNVKKIKQKSIANNSKEEEKKESNKKQEKMDKIIKNQKEIKRKLDDLSKIIYKLQKTVNIIQNREIQNIPIKQQNPNESNSNCSSLFTILKFLVMFFSVIIGAYIWNVAQSK